MRRFVMSRTVGVSVLASLLLAADFAPTAHGQSLNAAESWEPVELRAFREYLSLSGLAAGTDVLVAQVPCRGEVCLQVGVSGLSRDRLFSRLAGLITGFGYGADVESFSLSSSQAEFDDAVFHLTVPVGVSRLDAKVLAERAQHLLKVLRTLAALSAPGSTASTPSAVLPGSKTFLLASLTWQRAGKHGTARLAAPPESPRPVLPDEPSACPRWTLSLSQVSPAGQFSGWLLYDLTFHFDCPHSQGPVR